MQKNAFWMRISEWSSDVCLFDLLEFIDGLGYNINRPPNVGEAKLKGVEVSGQTFFDFLPGALSGFGVSGNFTYADSEVGGDDRLAGLPLQGVSKYNFNAGLFYDKFGLSARLVYRSEEHTSELQSLMRISYAVFCLQKKRTT